MKSEGKHVRSLLLLGAFALAFSCGKQTEDPTGGETHFLTRCDSKAACGSALACLCGVCTLPCDQRAECQGLPGGQCILSSSSGVCTDSAAPGQCDVPCAADVDCRVVSPSHRCEGGACRAGSAPAGTGGSGGSSNTGGSGGLGGETCEHGVTPANAVLLIGDSFFATSHQTTGYLESLARAAGALPAGARYRDNSTLLNNALALNGNGILDQYSRGVAEAPVKVVIMNGGGADLLLGSCNPPDPSCPTLTAAASAAQDLLQRMASDGVQHVLYVGYPDPVDSSVRAKMNAFRPLVQSACENAALPCHFVDLRTTFAGHYGEYIQGDGLNPTDAGSEASASAIWAAMQDRCIAQ
ncbi:MAG TPA: SGNH/GDSL hydrolase family protein [Polyangiaceae bacterium]|nr:SGNH/GDSL hydrolase family protein [Polyangiaceae bacterium]